MAVALSPHRKASNLFARTSIALLLSVALTWWIAFIFPHYQPMLRAELRNRINEARKKIPSVTLDWHRDNDPHAAYSPAKVALMIESRPIPHLPAQILHMISVVPPDWRFVFIGSEMSVLSLGRSYGMKYQQTIGKLDLMVLPDPWEIDSKEKVYRMLTDVRFYDEFLPGVEWVLKYESDSILCANSKSSLNEWLEWSWAGAPNAPHQRFYGNGGLSLRRVSAIKRVLAFQSRYNNSEPEDVWYGKRLWVLPGEKVATDLVGVLSVEGVYVEDPMGYHVSDGGKKLPKDVWKDHEQRKKIFEYCPELSIIMDMKLERERCEGDDKEGEIHPASKGAGEKQGKDATSKYVQDKEADLARQHAAQQAAETARKTALDAAGKANAKSDAGDTPSGSSRSVSTGGGEQVSGG